MLEMRFLKSLAVKNQTTEINVYREYCQHLFLSSFYRKRGSEEFLFKGGTALRIIFQSPRYSEDLDFSALSTDKIEDLLIETIKDLGNEGLMIEKIEESKETGGGYLSILNFSAPGLGFQSRIKLNILNIQKKEGGLLSSSKLISNEFVPPYSIVYLKDDVLVGEKIQAFLTRENAKERDFFDLYFILSDSYLRTQIQKNNPSKQEILTRLDSLSDNELKIGLKDLLPIGFHHLFAGDNFKTQIKRLVEMYL